MAAGAFCVIHRGVSDFDRTVNDATVQNGSLPKRNAATPTLAVVPKTVDAMALRTRSACCLHMPASATSSAIRNSSPPMRATAAS